MTKENDEWRTKRDGRRAGGVLGKHWWAVPTLQELRVLRQAGQLDGDAQAGVHVAGADDALVQADGALGDRQAQPDAAARPGPVVADAEEGAEDVVERLLRDARPAVPHGDRRGVRRQRQADLDGRPLGREVDRVAEHVL